MATQQEKTSCPCSEFLDQLPNRLLHWLNAQSQEHLNEQLQGEINTLVQNLQSQHRDSLQPPQPITPMLDTNFAESTISADMVQLGTPGLLQSSNSPLDPRLDPKLPENGGLGQGGPDCMNMLPQCSEVDLWEAEEYAQC